MVEERGVCRVLVGNPEGRRPMGRPKCTWAGHVALMGEERGCIVSWWGNRREGDHRGDLGVDGPGVWREWLRSRVCVGCWWEIRREGDQWRDLGVDGPGVWREWLGRVVCVGCWWEIRREGDQWGDLSVHGLGMWRLWVRRGGL